MKKGNVVSLWDKNNFDDYKLTYWHHILFWGLYFLFNTLRWGSYFDDYDYSFKTNILSFINHISLAYLNIYYLMPKFVYKRRFAAYGAAVLCCLLAALFLRYFLTYTLVSTNVWPEGPEPIDHITLNYAVQMMLGELYVMSFVTAIKITIDWLQEKNKMFDLEKRQLASELRFLRTQVSPHFFFNTLNNIYSLTLEKSDKAPELVLKLSHLMRYLLYATKEPMQPLKREIESIQNYIELERVRFDEALDIQFKVEGDLEDALIPPMLLIPLVENAFKHGANKSLGSIDITIDFKVIGNMLYFEVTNTIPPSVSTGNEEIGGIGLKNVKRRLKLGYEQGHYDFKVERGANRFRVMLKLKVK
jgi:two-component system, LytTR family, sensor kinase